MDKKEMHNTMCQVETHNYLVQGQISNLSTCSGNERDRYPHKLFRRKEKKKKKKKEEEDANIKSSTRLCEINFP